MYKNYLCHLIGDEYKVRIIISSVKDAHKLVSKYLNDNNQDYSDFNGLTLYEKSYYPVIWIKESLKNNIYSTLAHEAYHAICFVMERIGAKDEEIIAHLISSIIEEYQKYIKNDSKKMSKMRSSSKGR